MPEKERVDPRNTLNELTGRQWVQETKSVWFQRGLGGGHEHTWYERQHPAPFSYQDVRRLVELFTKRGERVLDPFAGVASTLKACALAERAGVGVELSKRWSALGRERLLQEVGPDALRTQMLVTGDARAVLPSWPDESFDFVVTSPPYWNILSKRPDHKLRRRTEQALAADYGDDPQDLGNIPSYAAFLEELVTVFAHCHRLLRAGRYAAVVVSDFRHGDRFIPFHAHLVGRLTEPNALLPVPFVLQGIKVLVQNQKPLYPYGYPFAYVENVHHQYILILRKPKPDQARKFTASQGEADA